MGGELSCNGPRSQSALNLTPPPLMSAHTSTNTTPAPSQPLQVRLVLEYCDLGGLREALDQGAFMTHTLNYHAILDTALDVAKAMCHLHAMNVLHSDLKV